MVRYYGYYSNVSRGEATKGAADEIVPVIIEPDRSSKEHRKNWARPIQKIYAVDPRVCRHWQVTTKIIGFIEDEDVIEEILKHLGLWDLKARPLPKVMATNA